MGWAIALHGGAGDIQKSERVEKAEKAMLEFLERGASLLREDSSKSALDVVEIVVRELENCPLFNAGKGSVLTTKGTVEMEASIMDGATGKCGAVSGLATVVNPISLARLVMEETPHIYLAFDGAQAFAEQQGVETRDPSYFVTEENIARLKNAQAARVVQLDYSARSSGEHLATPPELLAADSHSQLETVGCVAVDRYGNCAAATSTGGLVNKMVGRIGDTPLVGAGNYASSSCAISATGQGEVIIRCSTTRDVAALVEYKGLSLQEAADLAAEKLGKGNGGLIAVSNQGDVATAFNCTGMFRAYTSSKHPELKVATW